MILGIICEAVAVRDVMFSPPLLEDVTVFWTKDFTGSVALSGPRGKQPLEALALSVCTVFSFPCLIVSEKRFQI